MENKELEIGPSQLIRQRFSKAAESYEKEATVQRRIATTMNQLLQRELSPSVIRQVLEIGCGTGIFSRLLVRTFSPERMLLNDLCPEMKYNLQDLLNPQIRFQPGDAENYPFPDRYHLIASCSALQWFKDPGAFFTKAHSLLAPSGILAFSTFGKENMKEIAALTGQGLPYLSLREITGMLSPDYALIHASEEQITKTFPTAMEVLYHLKRTGVTGIQQQQWTKERLSRFCSEYNRIFNVDGSLPLTYHPIYIIAKKK
ncbi:malonyl-ACP O-methyltransferase BioC [Parabacteroides sp. PF5-6]|uniref:malonyl-ACP O-methyltransferase BioC n=1 Tax=Parabacteroides sp. PF5-6 TaxID=1742403 RepID=UPI0024060DCF|nr:malonyl-ACP O-methyltransferase BioC [Parabacteroides sp. PF5-6]MDF9830968.1 malonyl-ACP O-methyltransferase BioC [Parabacteroides sp. PF5-6]